MTEPDDDEQVRNQQVWTLITAHHSAIVSRLVFRTGNRMLAEDLAQDMWVIVGQCPGRYVDDPCPLTTLMSVAHRLANNYLRRQRRRGEQQPGADAITALSDNSITERLWRGVRRLRVDRRGDSRAVPHCGRYADIDAMWYADMRLDFGEAVGMLPPRQQEALYLRYHDDMTSAAIALHMHISRQAVDKLLDKAHTALRRSPRLAGWNGKEVDR